MPPVFPGVRANSLPELATALGLDPTRFMETLNAYNAACRPGTFDHTKLDDCRTDELAPPKTHWALPLDTPPGVVTDFAAVVKIRNAGPFGIDELQLQGGSGIADLTGAQVLAGRDKISPAILATRTWLASCSAGRGSRSPPLP